MKDKLKKFDQFFLDHLLFPLTMFFLIIVCFMILSFTSHAEEPYFPMNQNESGDFTDYLDTINNYFDTDNYYYVMYKSAQYGDGVGFTYVKALKSDGEFYGEISNDGFHWSLYRLNNSSSISVGLLAVTYNQTVYDTYVGGNYGSYFSNLVSSNYDNTVSYASNFRIYANNNENSSVILKYGPDPVGPVDVGVAIIPPDPILPDFDNLIPPSKVPPSYSGTDYTWTTPPSFDGSSVEAALGSIQNVLGWIANNLKEEFKNLTDNLEGFFKYIGETIQYYAGIIIDTLINFMTNFYDNMASLVQPIFEKLAYITEELDIDEVNTAFNNTSFIGIKNQFTTLFTNFESAFDISEPSTFTLTINIQNIRTFYNFGCRSPVIIHLDDHFIPIRTALRTFLWILISFGTVFIVERGLSDWIRGENDTK